MTAVFAPNTRATAHLPDGSSRALPGPWTVRLTEYTVGERGVQAMPGELPSSVAYTYAAEFSVDEARALGASSVEFEPPVVAYVDNFLHFPAGTTVPSGYYDRAAGAWRAEPSGVVLDVLGAGAAGLAFDTDGDGQADDAAKLQALGVSAAELTLLRTERPDAASLWRVPLHHFSAFDFNWGFVPPLDASFGEPNPQAGGASECRNEASGSIIGCNDQTLGEVLEVPGTGRRLHYQSERTPGRKDSRVLELQLTPAQVPASLARVELEIEVLGQVHRKSFGPQPNQRHRFEWDGKDAYGRQWQGRQQAHVRLGYVYPGSYAAAPSFGQATGQRVSGDATRQEVTLWADWQGPIGEFDLQPASLGGWSLDIHHTYDPMARVLYLGHGRFRSAEALGAVITTVAGRGDAGGAAGDGGPATAARIGTPHGVVVDGDGTVYVSEEEQHVVRRIRPDGVIEAFAGTGVAGFSGDGGRALDATLNRPMGLALGRDGTLYIADLGNGRVRAVSKDGRVRTVAGKGASADLPGDGGPATAARLDQPHALAVAADGTLFIADQARGTVRRVGPDGVIHTVAGGGSQDGRENVPATQVRLSDPLGLALGPNQELYVTEWTGNRVRRIDPSGLIHTVLGLGTGSSDDGALARTAKVEQPHTVDVGADGSLYVTEEGKNRVRRIRPDGRIETVAGGGDALGDGGSPFSAKFRVPRVVYVHRDGSLWIADYLDHRVRRVRPSLPEFTGGESVIASSDGARAYVFDTQGRHQRTLDAWTQTELFRFSYDGAGRLIEVRDRDGDVTRIERDGQGRPSAIVGPYGARSPLQFDAEGWLRELGSPLGTRTELQYAPGGLLTRMSWSALPGLEHRFEYDALGKLTADLEPSGARAELTASQAGAASVVTLRTRLGLRTRHEQERAPGRETLRVIGPDGLRRSTTITPAGLVQESPFGVISVRYAGDPQFAMQAPYPGELLRRTPSGRTQTITRARNATFADPTDPLSMRQWTERVRIGSREHLLSWDAASRTLQTQSPEGRTQTVTLDARGRIDQLSVPSLPSRSYVYDARGRVERVRVGARETSFGYDAAGYLAQMTDPLGQRVSWRRDAVGKPEQLTLPDGAQVGVQWDGAERLSGLSPAGQPAHRFGYRALELLADYTPPPATGAGGRTAWQYDDDDRLREATRADGSVVRIGYDAAGRFAELSAPGVVLSARYDAQDGSLSELERAGSTLRLERDGVLPLAQRWQGAIRGAVEYEWATDFVPSAEVVQGTRLEQRFDRDGLLTRAGALTLTRDSRVGLVTATDAQSSRDAFSYDAEGHLSRYEARQNGNAIYSVDYTRDGLGRVLTRREVAQGVARDDSFRYDARGRLIEVHRGGALLHRYGYDANGNRVSADGVASSYDAQDRQLTHGAAQVAHNALGERVSASGRSYVFSGLGELSKVQRPGGAEVEYLYDAASRRIGKKLGGALTRGYLYRNDLQIAAELDGSGQTRSVFVYGARHVPELMLRGGVTYRLLSDERGSVRLVVNAQSGAVSQVLDYDPYGQITRDTSPGFQPFGFAGGLYDADTGLVRFGVRDYDPSTGRWVQKDPSGFSGGLNFYEYAAGDPINYIDPTGRDPEGAYIGAALGAAVGAGYGAHAGALIGASGGALVGGPAGAAVGAGGGALVGGLLGAAGGWTAGAALGDALGDALDSILAMAKGGRGNVADSGVMNQMRDYVRQNGGSNCEALEAMMAAAKAACDTEMAKKIKATQKSQGCRHSSASK